MAKVPPVPGSTPPVGKRIPLAYLPTMRWIFALLFLWPASVAANDWDALEQLGAMAIMRHALAPGTGDPADFRLDDCTTQRNLDARGRNQARAIGAALRGRAIVFDVVLTSQWCRTRETAELLGLAEVVDAPELNSFFQDFARRDVQTRAALDLLSRTEGRAILLSHQVNISALTGQGTHSGEVLVIRMSEGKVEVLGTILLDP